jgi:hypothetical protein
MLINEKQKLAEVLVKTASALDIPDHVYEDAVVKYEGVGAWLAADDSEIKQFTPEIYPQGSFRLGTVVRPIADYEYDIDLVCLLKMRKEDTTQKNLKKIVGDRLKQHDFLKQILTPSRRCWLLDYPLEQNRPAFHMDVLPAVPNLDRLPDGILLTDTELTQWQKSNPKRYAEWFYERIKVILMEKRAAVAKAIRASVEEVPEWQVKTPLQIAIQVLKRHRDIHFQSEAESRPASIIVTTLAAQSYRNQPDIYDAFIDIARDMPRFIENRNGRWWVANPVEPDENFADRWNEHPERRVSFVRWLSKVQSDFSQLAGRQTLNEAVSVLSPLIGASIMAKAANDLGLQGYPLEVQSAVQVPGLSDARHCQSPLWPVRQTYQATVTASVHFKKNGKKLWDYIGRAVPKNVWLKFRVTTNAPQPYDVRWQVVNTGREAFEARQLRGAFYEGDAPGNTVRWETTKYSGTHWVEAFVIKGNVCAARSGKTAVRIR